MASPAAGLRSGGIGRSSTSFATRSAALTVAGSLFSFSAGASLIACARRVGAARRSISCHHSWKRSMVYAPAAPPMAPATAPLIGSMTPGAARIMLATVGTLYLVATPIGNLEDVSGRALKVLQDVHMVACEDTRHTQILLRRHEIRAKHLTSYTEFNHKRQVGVLVGQLDRGWDVALVSDAGTPALSDPGEALVAAAVAAGHTVTPIPGPNAAIAALVASGLPTRAFTFLGFLTKKSGARRKTLATLIAEGRTIVVYESPYRTGDLLEDLAAVAPDARVVVARAPTTVNETLVP